MKAAEQERLRPRPLLAVAASLRYCPQTARFLDLAHKGRLAQVLDAWRRAEDLETAAMRVLGVWSAQPANDPPGRPGPLVGLRRSVADVLKSMQLASLREDGRFIAAREQLAELARANFLVPDSTIMAGPAIREGRLPVDSIGITTRGRPRQLLMSVQSALGNALRYDRRPRVYVVDDSVDKASRDGTRAALAGLARATGCSVSYVDRRHRRRLVESLSRAGLPPAIVRHAFSGWDDGEREDGCGAARNCLLLLIRGGGALLMPDSAQAELLPHPSSIAGIQIAERSRYPSLSDGWMREPPARGSGDTLGVYENFIGRKVAEVASEQESRLGAMCSHIFNGLENGSARIIAASTGTLYPTTSAESSSSRSRSSADEGFVALRFTGQATVSHDSSWASPSMGIDARHQLPPFLPGCALEWSLFGDMAQLCFLDAFPVQLPWATLYSECPAGIERVARTGDGTTLGLDEVMAACLSSIPVEHVDEPAQRLRRLGHGIEELAKLPSSDFADQLRQAVWARFSEEMRELESEYLGRRPQEINWSDGRRRACIDPLFLIPAELRTLGPQAGMNALQLRVSAFGQLLQWWPEVVRATEQEVKAHDLLLGETLS